MSKVYKKTRQTAEIRHRAQPDKCTGQCCFTCNHPILYPFNYTLLYSPLLPLFSSAASPTWCAGGDTPTETCSFLSPSQLGGPLVHNLSVAKSTLPESGTWSLLVYQLVWLGGLFLVVASICLVRSVSHPPDLGILNQIILLQYPSYKPFLYSGALFLISAAAFGYCLSFLPIDRDFCFWMFVPPLLIFLLWTPESNNFSKE